MIKKSITFDDFDGNEVTEDHYFHLSNAELIAWATENGGGLEERLTATVKSGDIPKIMEVFNEIIRRSYGIREGAGSFRKSPEISEQFMTSLAFDAFFMNLLTNVESAVEFINGIVPSALVKQIQASQGDTPGQLALSEIEGVKGDLSQGGSDETAAAELAEDQRSGLKRPRDTDGNLLPWAFRKPTRAEQQKMTRPQLQDVMNRMSSGWEPAVQSV